MIPKVVYRHRFRILTGFVLVVIVYHLLTKGTVVKVPVISETDESGRVENPVGYIEASVPGGGGSSGGKTGGVDGGSGGVGSGSDTDSDVELAKAKIEAGKSKDKEADKETEKETEEEAQAHKETDKEEFKILPIDPDSANAAKAGVKQKGDKNPEKPVDPVLASIHDYTIFFEEFEKHKIQGGSVKKKYKTEHASELFSDDKGFLFSKEYLENVLDIPDTTVVELTDSHDRYLKAIDRLVDTVGLSTFGNILKTEPEWQEYEGSKGFVLIGGGRYSWLSYLVIKQIRAVGSTMPIELFIPSSSEYEKEFCDVLLPKYNAYCNMIDDKITNTVCPKYDIGGYQYKMLALLSSKFENIIYLDSDNFPVRDPEYILDSKLYQEKGLILWPDAWARTTNPKFYDIAGVKVKENKIRYTEYDIQHGQKPLDKYTFADTWYHTFEGTLPDPTSETGMLIVNKTKHLRTLLLTLYYNVLGPHYYYPLMTQGSAGEGDKETFIAAAHVLGLPWYQTLKQFKWVGYDSEIDGDFTSKALGHYDPLESEINPEADIPFVFMHLSYPKFYPNWLVDNHDLIYEKSGNHIRMYQDIYKSAGYDFDLRVLQFFTQGLCRNYYDESGMAVDGSGVKSDEYMGKYLLYVADDAEIEDKRCSEVFIPHLKWLRETSPF